MTDIPETGRLAGHVLIDAVMADDADGEDSDANIGAMDLALTRLGEIHAVRVSRSGDGDSVQVDASNLVAPAIDQAELHARFLEDLLRLNDGARFGRRGAREGQFRVRRILPRSKGRTRTHLPTYRTSSQVVGRATQRNPRWDVAVSTCCGILAAGR
jgi:hypothetical protein